MALNTTIEIVWVSDIGFTCGVVADGVDEFTRKNPRSKKKGVINHISAPYTDYLDENLTHIMDLQTYVQ